MYIVDIFLQALVEFFQFSLVIILLVEDICQEYIIIDGYSWFMPLVVAKENLALPIIVNSGRFGILWSRDFYSSNRGSFLRKN